MFLSNKVYGQVFKKQKTLINLWTSESRRPSKIRDNAAEKVVLYWTER